MKLSLFTLSVLVSVSVSANDNQTLFETLCIKPDQTVNYQVKVDQGLAVQTLAGDRMQVIGQHKVTADEQWLTQQIKAQGVSDDCASYVMSRGYWQQHTPVARVHFNFDRHELTADGRRLLNHLMTQLNRHDAISVIGHTDNVGAERYNQSLSLQRAVEVGNYLTENRSDLTLEMIARGESQPVTSNATPAGRAVNRRADVMIEQ